MGEFLFFWMLSSWFVRAMLEDIIVAIVDNNKRKGIICAFILAPSTIFVALMLAIFLPPQEREYYCDYLLFLRKEN